MGKYRYYDTDTYTMEYYSAVIRRKSYFVWHVVHAISYIQNLKEFRRGVLTYYAQDPGWICSSKRKKCQILTLADRSVVIISAQRMRKQNWWFESAKHQEMCYKGLIFSMDFIGHNSLRNIKFKRREAFGRDEYMDDLDANDCFTSAYSLPISHQVKYV